MNRTFAFGIAMFFAVVAIALMGGDNAAVAGHGCHGAGGCDGYVACDGGCGGGLFGGRKHHRRGGGLFGKHRNGGCCGEVQTCCGVQQCAPVCEPTCHAAPVCASGCDTGCAPAAPTCAGYQGGYDVQGQGGYGQPVPAGDDMGPPPAPQGDAPQGNDAPPAPQEPSAKNIRAPYQFHAVSFRR